MERKQKVMSEKEAISRLAALCARTEYCLSDIRRKMEAWLLPEGADERIIRRLTSDGYVDENRYAHAFVRSKFRFNRWGREKIARALKMKGISDEDIADGLTELNDEEAEQTLMDLLIAKNRHITYKNDYDRYMKLLRFAVGRGFSIDAARRCIEKMDINEETCD